MKVSLLGGQHLLVAEKEYSPNRLKSQLSNAGSGILVLRLTKLIYGNDISSDQRQLLDEAAKGLCRKLRQGAYLPPEYQPMDLIRDLSSADLDAYDLAEAIRNLDLAAISKFGFHHQGDFIANLSRYFHPSWTADLTSMYRTLLEGMLIQIHGPRFEAFHDLLDSIRKTVRRHDQSDPMSEMESETTRVLQLGSEDRDIALRRLWTTAWNANRYTDVKRSLEICEPVLGGTGSFAVAKANYYLGIGELDVADIYVEEAKSRFEESGAAESHRIALTHLNARVLLRKFEQCHSYTRQHEILEDVIMMTAAFPTSVHLKLLRANTLVRRAYFTKDFDVYGVQSPSEQDAKDWSDRADRIYKDLCRPVKENTERHKAFVARCYLHALSQALGHGKPNGDSVDLYPPLLHHIANQGKDDPFAYSVAAYCNVVRRRNEEARRILAEAAIANLAQRRDKGTVFFASLGYLLLNEIDQNWEFCRVVLVDVLSRRSGIQLEENFEPLFRSTSGAKTNEFSRELVRSLRWGLGLDPLRCYKSEFRQLVDGESRRANP